MENDNQAEEDIDPRHEDPRNPKPPNRKMSMKIKASQGERQERQKKVFTRWLNAKLQQAPSKPQVKNLFLDLRDGNILHTLLEVLTGKKVERVKGRLRVHKLNNVSLALALLDEYKLKLVNISNTDIVDGEPIPTLGLIWSLIYRFQIQGALVDPFADSDRPTSPIGESQAEAKLMEWATNAVKGYERVDIKNFSSSWKDGLAFNALIHSFRPDLFDYNERLSKLPKDNLEHAFTVAEKNVGVPKLLEPSDLQREPVDSKYVVMYVSSLYEKLMNPVEPQMEGELSSGPLPPEEIEELKSFIQIEIRFLQESNEYLGEPKNIPEDDEQQLIEEYRNLINFVDDLQPHQERVGELVTQTENLLQADLVQPEEERRDLEYHLDGLKEAWLMVFDKTTARQNRLRGLLLKLLDGPHRTVNEALETSAEELNNFADNPATLFDTWSQYNRFKDYIDGLRKLEGTIEEIRTGVQGGAIIEVLPDEDEDDAMDKIKELVARWEDLEVDVVNTKNRICGNLLDLCQEQLQNLRAYLQSVEGETLECEDLEKDLETLQENIPKCQDLLEQLRTIEADIAYLCEVCEKFDEDLKSENVQSESYRKDTEQLRQTYDKDVKHLEDVIER